jgi:hypothetical protein
VAVPDAPSGTSRFSLGTGSVPVQVQAALSVRDARLACITDTIVSSQVYLRLNAVSVSSGTEATDHVHSGPLRLPVDAVKVLAATSKSRAGSSKTREQALFRQLVRDQLLLYLEAVARHPQFPAVLAAAVGDAGAVAVGAASPAAGAKGAKR